MELYVNWTSMNAQFMVVYGEYCSLEFNCTNTIGGYSCNCPDELTGYNCTDDVDECAEHNCHDNGECLNFYGGYNCTCGVGYDVSTNCATLFKAESDDDDDDDAERQRLLMALYVGIALLAVTTAVLIFMIYVDVTQTSALKKTKCNARDLTSALSNQ